jgi:hypothetical protein
MELQLRKGPPIEKGQVAVVQGTTIAKGLRFRLNSLSVLQPVIATVLARDEHADLRVSLLKPGDEAPSRPRLTGRAPQRRRLELRVDWMSSSMAPAEHPSR